MRTQIYRILNRHTQAWWYHQDLRQRGQVAEARRRERRSIRDWVTSLRETLQNRGYLHIAPHGTTFVHSDSRRTTCDWPDNDMLALAHACRIPILDTRTIPAERRWDTIRLPMIGLTQTDSPPWHSCSFAPMAEVFQMYAALGATISHYPLQASPPAASPHPSNAALPASAISRGL